MKNCFLLSLIFIICPNNFYNVLTLPTRNEFLLKEETDLDEYASVVEDNAASQNLNPEQIGGHYQGDMIFPDDLIRGAADRPISQRWPNGIIPYEITPSIMFNHSLLILDAMRLMENLTKVGDVPCIQFRPKTVDDSIFIIIQNGTGCSAYVGYLQDYILNRTVTLMHTPTSTCMITGTIQHELLHVLGFYHEQSRPDRDDYVSIQWPNIINGTEFNFVKYSEEKIDTLMLPYDYGSVMHYGATAFSVNGESTIIPTQNASAILGQRIGMSPIDILEVQRYYGCVATPTSTTPSTSSTSTSTTSLTSSISTSTTSSTSSAATSTTDSISSTSTSSASSTLPVTTPTDSVTSSATVSTTSATSSATVSTTSATPSAIISTTSATSSATISTTSATSSATISTTSVTSLSTSASSSTATTVLILSSTSSSTIPSTISMISSTTSSIILSTAVSSTPLSTTSTTLPATSSRPNHQATLYISSIIFTIVLATVALHNPIV